MSQVKTYNAIDLLSKGVIQSNYACATHLNDTYDFYNGDIVENYTGWPQRFIFATYGTNMKIYNQSYYGRNRNVELYINNEYVKTIDAGNRLATGLVNWFNESFNEGLKIVELRNVYRNDIGEHTEMLLSKIEITDGDFEDLNKIDISNIYTPKLNQGLTCPEYGWERINANNDKIIYQGSWTNDTCIGSYNKYRKLTNTKDSICKFYFKGSKIRIIGADMNTYANNIFISIDGNEYSFNENIHNSNSNSYPCISQSMVFEKLDLMNVPHEVIIKNIDSNSKYVVLDAIDLYKTDNSSRMMTEEEYYSNRLIKTSDKYIGGAEFSLDTSLLDIKNDIENGLISIDEINTKIKDITEDYSIIKVV